ncbi:MAG: pentapeptide repeat-containing protein [Gemmatimonadales bacterium]
MSSHEVTDGAGGRMFPISARPRPPRSGLPSAGDTMRAPSNRACRRIALAVSALPVGAYAGPASATASVPPAATVDSPTVRLDLAGLKQRLESGGSDGPDLTRVDLSGLDLAGLDFRRANLTGARLSRAKLPGANLFSCDLTDADLSGADLTKANMDGTVLRRATLKQANLTGASLFATIIEAADLSGANLSGTRIIGYLRSAKLPGADLRNSNAGADPGNQSMGVMRATFVGADLKGADLSGANLYKADFSHADLTGAKLQRVNLENADLLQTDFTGADLTGAKMAKADIDGAIFTSAVGVSQIQGLDQARNRDKATFDAP